jgi:hypothetical protein
MMSGALLFGLDSVVAPIEEGRLDFHPAFVEAHVPIGKTRIAARLGRQEIGIGNQTVFDMREGAYTRRALDLLRVMGDLRQVRRRRAGRPCLAGRVEAQACPAGGRRIGRSQP